MLSIVFLSIGIYFIYLNMTITPGDINKICNNSNGSVVAKIKNFDY